MIRLMKENDLPMLQILSSETIFLSRILSTYQAYAGTNLATIWIQLEKDRMNAVLCKVDRFLTMATLSVGNDDELAGFLYAVDADWLVCDGAAAQRLYPGQALTGPILSFHHLLPTECAFEYTINPPLQEAYQLMEQCQEPGFVLPPWEPFYLDMNHRIRHGTANAIGIRGQDGKLCACGFITFKTSDVAILSGVCVAPDYRRQGLGTQMVNALLSQLTQEYVYVFRDADRNVEFYQSLEFTECGTWAEVGI